MISQKAVGLQKTEDDDDDDDDGHVVKHVKRLIVYKLVCLPF